MLAKELEKEFQQTNGWLKIQKLNECTQKTAREKLMSNDEVRIPPKIKKSLADTIKDQ